MSTKAIVGGSIAVLLIIVAAYLLQRYMKGKQAAATAAAPAQAAGAAQSQQVVQAPVPNTPGVPAYNQQYVNPYAQTDAQANAALNNSIISGVGGLLGALGNIDWSGGNSGDAIGYGSDGLSDVYM